jgi:hypothetical protein
LRAVYKWISTLIVVAVVFQIGFAAYGAFYAAHKLDKSNVDPKVVTEDQFDHGFDAHFIGFAVIAVLVLALLAVGLIGGYGRWRLGTAGVLVLLVILQLILAGIAFSVPAIGFFHAVNALVILAVAGMTARSEWAASKAPATSPVAEPAATV